MEPEPIYNTLPARDTQLGVRANFAPDELPANVRRALGKVKLQLSQQQWKSLERMAVIYLNHYLDESIESYANFALVHAFYDKKLRPRKLKFVAKPVIPTDFPTANALINMLRDMPIEDMPYENVLCASLIRQTDQQV